jgi:hypothetical protein
MVDEPQAPLNADAGVVVELPVDPLLPVEEEPVPVVPAVPLTLDGDVGVKSFDDCSNAQPVASVEASNRLIRERFFMIRPYSFVSAHTVLVCTGGPFAQNSQEIEESTYGIAG